MRVTRPATAATLPSLAVLAVLAVLLIACASAPRNPVLDKYPTGVSGRTTVLYYDVHGRTFQELQADMHRLGPKIDGNSYVGETRSPMRWSWRTESIGLSSCSIREVNVVVNAQITLPRWTPPPDTEPGLVAEWKRFIAALETHEAGHKDISAKAAHDIIEKLRGVAGPCSGISARANDLARMIVARASDEQKAYDASTRHGLTQGTAFGIRRFAGMTVGGVPDSLTLLTGLRVGTVRGFLPGPIDRVWTALPAAFAANELTINATDSSAHAMGDSVTVRGMIGPLRVGDVVDCGTPPTGRNADSVSVSLFVTSRLEPKDPATTMATITVQAVVRPPKGTPIACRSRAVLERRLFESLVNQIAR
jgi:predicted secreted Zn-dependent protease